MKLNGRGRRFTNEGIFGYWGAGLQGARQPRGPICTIWDVDWEQQLQYQSVDHTSVEINVPRVANMLRSQMAEAVDKGCLRLGGGPPGMGDSMLST